MGLAAETPHSGYTIRKVVRMKWCASMLDKWSIGALFWQVLPRKWMKLPNEAKVDRIIKIMKLRIYFYCLEVKSQEMSRAPLDGR